MIKDVLDKEWGLGNHVLHTTLDHDLPGSVEKCDDNVAEGSLELVNNSLSSSCFIMEGGDRCTGSNMARGVIMVAFSKHIKSRYSDC